MTRLLVCAALGVEARALRRGLATVDLPRGLAEVRVVRTGAGPRRAARAASTLPPYDALAVAGFGGAVDPSLRPGDVVVASEVRFGDRAYPCPSAPLLASELARDGLRTHVGPLLTCDHVVREAERPHLARLGALAVDMETGPLAEAAYGDPPAAAAHGDPPAESVHGDPSAETVHGDPSAEAARSRPIAAVRVIVDAPGTPLLGLAVVRAGLTARRVLRRVAPALARWASSAAPPDAYPSPAHLPDTAPLADFPRRNTPPALRPTRAEDTVRFPPPGEVLL
ncbi:hypothetical protein AB0M95_00380 [Sphaerisporangium sp. NPDC051017]|uniref:5'-methylthioadenosine/S-adenosylhomocysteine nucleosidase family protein n=1 Tax=Sphaerisporangium sp. NPDC051017 TaxID=3154636 RepID=UPI00341F8FFD